MSKPIKTEESKTPSIADANKVVSVHGAQLMTDVKQEDLKQEDQDDLTAMEDIPQYSMTGLEIYAKELMNMVKDNQKHDSVLPPYHKSNANNLTCRKMYIASSGKSETLEPGVSERPSTTETKEKHVEGRVEEGSSQSNKPPTSRAS